jgi:hypothetical protein
MVFDEPGFAYPVDMGYGGGILYFQNDFTIFYIYSQLF